MERPAGVTVIGGTFFLVAGYLFVVGTIELAALGTIAPSMRAPFMYGRELAGPQSAFLVGAGWALVGWGLWQVRNWARWSTIVLMVIGIAGGIPAVSAAAVDPGMAAGVVWRADDGESGGGLVLDLCAGFD
jgi:hypothetical protein